MNRYVTLVDDDGCLAAIIPFDPNDRKYDELTGAKLGSTSMTDTDKSQIMEAYGAALVEHKRQHIAYKWTTNRGKDHLEIDVIRFPSITVSAMLFSEVVPDQPAKKKLTKREKTIISLSIDDLSDAEIAAKLKIARSTVARHKQNIRQKMGAKEWAAAVARYLGH
ncbi:MAG: helix-turn-helix transcriptional regulator [Planctomycetota bacterium]